MTKLNPLLYLLMTWGQVLPCLAGKHDAGREKDWLVETGDGVAHVTHGNCFTRF